jgi:hypothetical protein
VDNWFVFTVAAVIAAEETTLRGDVPMSDPAIERLEVIIVDV